MGSSNQFFGKNELAGALGLSRNTIKNYLNERYYDRISPLGYKKTDKKISPKVLDILGSIIGFSQEDVLTYRESLKTHKKARVFRFFSPPVFCLHRLLDFVI